MRRLAILGAGSWGTALAIAQATRFQDIRLWTRSSEQSTAIANQRENRRYLPGFPIPNCVQVTHRLSTALEDAEVVLIAVPSEHLRAVVGKAASNLPPETILVSATKGIENGTLLRMSQVITDAVSETVGLPMAVLSGPTFAKEIAAGEPAAVVVASENPETASTIQQAFSTVNFRLYVSKDVVGVEMGAALKNVIAIGGGICKGLGLGSNSVAALVTRGLAEITRLAVAMGGSLTTLSGLAGLGDLVLTTTGDLSRNRLVGVQLGQGRELSAILSETTMVAEGVGTCRAAYQLGRKLNVELPIIDRMYEVLYQGKPPRQAIRELMERPLTSE